MLVPFFGNDVDRTADQADEGHLRLLSDAVAVGAVVIEQLPGVFPVGCFHGIFPQSGVQ